MAGKPRILWDTTALISAVLSGSSESPGRRLLRLGESGAILPCVSREVLRDLEYAIRKRKHEALAKLAAILDAAQCSVTPDTSAATVERCDADVLVTYDAVHFLGNPLIGPPATRLRAMTPDHAIAWCREMLSGM